MGKRFIIDVDTDDDHLLVNAGYDSVVTKAQVSSDSLSDLLSVLDASTTTGYGDIYTLPEEEPGLSTTAWIFVAVFCFAAGLSVSFWYSKG